MARSVMLAIIEYPIFLVSVTISSVLDGFEEKEVTNKLQKLKYTTSESQLHCENQYAH